MNPPDLGEQPTYRINQPVICSGCTKPFHTGQVWIEEGVIVNSMAIVYFANPRNR